MVYGFAMSKSTSQTTPSPRDPFDDPWQKALAYAARGSTAEPDAITRSFSAVIADPDEAAGSSDSVRSREPVAAARSRRAGEDGRSWETEDSAVSGAAASLWHEEDVPFLTKLRQTLSTPVLAAVTIAAVALVAVVLNLVLKPQSLPNADPGTSDSAASASQVGAKNTGGARNSAAGKAGADRGSSAGSGESGGNSGRGAAGRGADVPVVAHIIGQVQQPGVYELPAKSRVKDLVEAAGGLTDAAVLTGVNLARVVNDGEQIHIPTQQEIDSGAFTGGAAQAGGAGAGGGGGGGGGSGGGGSGGSGSGEGKINLNTATVEQLQQLPRIGPATAQKIVEWRSKNGGFKSIEDLLEIPGIGDKTVQNIASQVSV